MRPNRPTPPPGHPTRPSIIGAARQQPTTTNGRRGGAARGPRPQPTHPAHPGHAPATSGTLAERVKHDPALLARALADPGLRSQLPDQYLSPDQLKVRRDREFRENVGNIDEPLSGDSLINTAQTLTDRDFAPLLQDIDRSQGAVQARVGAQGQRAASYFGGIGAQQGATLAGQMAANNAAVAAAGQRQAAALGGVNQAADAAQADATHDAQVRGAGLQGDMIAQMAADRASAAQRAQTEGQADAASTAANGDASAAFLRGTQAATAQAGGETQGQIIARGDSDLSDLANQRAKLLQDRKGQFTDTLLKMRNSEADRLVTERGLANDEEKALLDFKAQMAGIKSQAQIQAANRALKARLTAMGLDAKAAQAEADRATQQAIAAGHDATSQANTAATTSASRANNAATNATSRANNRDTNHQSDVNSRRGHAGGAGGFTHQQLAQAAQKRDDALTLAQQYKNRRASRDTALQLLTEKYGSDFARVAVGAIYDGGAKPHLESLMEQRYGIHIPKQYRTPTR